MLNEIPMMITMNALRTLIRSIAAVALLLAACPHATHAQSGGSSLSGTEYFVAFMPNEDKRGANDRFMGLMISSEVPTTGTIEIRKAGGGTEAKPFATQPGQATTIPIDRSLTLQYEDDGPSIHITSRAPISVFVLNSLVRSTGGYAAVPVNLWGRSYLPITLPNADGERVGEFAVIAAENGTQIRITPSAQTTYREPGSDIVATLQKGETFFLQSRARGVGSSDLTASEIRATKPIGVISGHVRAPITADGSMPTDRWASHMAVMLLPDSLWGTEFLTVPIGSAQNRFKMTAATNGTTVQVIHYGLDGSTDQAMIQLNRGTIFDGSTINGKPITGPVHWSASNPVLLTQMRTSGTYGTVGNEPAFIMVPALDRFTVMSPFVAPAMIGSAQITAHTLTILAKGDGSAPDNSANPINAITLDGKALTTVFPGMAWKKVESGYYSTTVSIEAGAHVLSSLDGFGFSATVSGTTGVPDNFYTWQVPFWIPRTQADVKAPYVLRSEPATGRVTLTISDSADGYFSGVAAVQPVINNNWKTLTPFITPAPDDAVDMTFETTGDPSGPLYLMLSDRNGNVDTVKAFDGFCRQSAYAANNSVTIRTTEGVARTDSIAITANPCGDAADVRGIDLGTGTAKDHLQARFNAGATAFTITSHGTAMLYFTVDAGAKQGVYTTTAVIALADTTISLLVRLEIDKAAAVGYTAENTMNVTAVPNPFSGTTRITFGRTMGPDARMVVTDPMGRPVFHLAAESLIGRESVLWQGTDDAGHMLPSGTYFVSVRDAHGRALLGTTLVR